MEEKTPFVPCPSGQRGSAVLAALGFIFALSSLTLLGFLAARADLLVAVQKKKEREMFFAGEAVLHIAAARIGSPGNPVIPQAELFSPAGDFVSETREGFFSGWRYLWRASFLPDEGNRDGDSTTDAVLYSRNFGFAGSPFASGGYPVVRVDAVVEQGTRRGALTAGMAFVVLSPRIEAAWTAAGPLSLEGEMLISGLDHRDGGEAVAEGGRDVAAVRSGGAVASDEEVVLAGAAGASTVVGDEECAARDPLAFLNPGATLASLAELPPPPQGEILRGMVYSRGSWEGPLNGDGVVVVHNPLYDPVRYEASRLAAEEGVFPAEYDPDYSHLDPAHQPASLELSGGGDFRGLVLADRLGTVTADTRVVGAVVTLAREHLSLEAMARLEILYSSEAVKKAARGPLLHRVFFKSLPGTKARMARLESTMVRRP